MIPWWWSWLLTGIGITGLWMLGNRWRAGFLVGLFAQVLWIAYAITTDQPGFFVSAVVYGAVNIRNYHAWKPRSGGGVVD
jgi:hypothetical protein